MGRGSVSLTGGGPVVIHLPSGHTDRFLHRPPPSAPAASASRCRSCCCCPASLASCTVKLAKALIPLTISFAAGAVLDHFYGTRVIRSVEALWP